MSRRHSFAGWLAAPIPRGFAPALAASSETRLRGPTTHTRTGWAASASVLLHLGLLLLLFVAAKQARKLAEPVPPIPVDVIFQGGSKTPPSVPTPGHPSQTKPASPAPQPQPSVKPVPPTPPPAAAPATPPVQAAPRPAPAPPAAPETAPPQPAARPTPSPPRAQPPPVSRTEATPTRPVPSPPRARSPSVPQPEATPTPPVPRTEAVPTSPAPSSNAAPPPPAAATSGPALPLPPPPVPAPRPPAARAVPRRRSAFPMPMEFSFNGSPGMSARPTEHRAPPRSGAIDLSFAPPGGASNGMEIHAEADGKEVGPDWLNRVAAWWAQHGYYPDEAARLGQHGDVTVSMKVAHDGRVEVADVTHASNSPWLNLGALSVFRNANLPPLPAEVTASNIDLTFTIHYIIVP